MITIEVNITKDSNLEYLQSILGDLPAYLERYLWQRLLPVAQSIASEAQSYAPERTGRLKNSIVAVITVDGIAVRCTVDYAKFQEYGTKYIIPKMFMNSAMQNHYEEIRQVIKEVIQEYFQKVVA